MIVFSNKEFFVLFFIQSLFRIHIMSGKVNKVTAVNDDVYVKNLSYALQKFEKEGIVGLIEPINNITVPNYYMNSFQKGNLLIQSNFNERRELVINMISFIGLDVIKKINKPNLKLQLDIFHLQHICGNITKNIKELLPYIGI